MAFGIGGKLKDFLGSAANKAADKLIPKELAPFLPLLAPMFMGPGAGIMSRYLMPQLLAALSTGKTSGDISGTGQALAGLGSFLSDPGRMAIGEKIKPGVEGVDEIKGLPDSNIAGSEKVVFGKIDPETGLMMPDPTQPHYLQPRYGEDMVQATVGDLPKPYTHPTTGQPINVIEANSLGMKVQGDNLMVLPGSGTNTIGYGAGQIDPRLASEVITTPGVTAVPAGMENIYTLEGLEDAGQKASILDYLKIGGNEARDFIQGTNVTNKSPGGDQVTVGTDSQAIGKQRIDPYDLDYQQGLQDRSALKFGYKDPALMETGAKYAAGDPMLVRDANFGYNMPRRAVQSGIATLGPTMNKMDKMKQDAADQEALFQGNLDAYGDARSNFFDYFRNSQPNYGMLYGGGYANGGRIGYQDGSDEMGVQPFSYEGFESGGGMMDALMAVLKNKLKGDPMGTGEPNMARKAIYEMLGIETQANGGRIGLNMGGMGSIPQTPMIPQGQQLDGRGGGFIPMGAQEKRDDVPAMLAKNEFVMTSDAVRAAGGGSIEKGAQRMYDMMNQLEAQV